MGDDVAILIDAAVQAGREHLLTEPRAASAQYDAKSELIMIALTNGCSFAFPVGLVPELAEADAARLAQVEVLGLGIGLHWEALDVDLSVPALLAGLFGTREWLNRQRAAHAGGGRSLAKASAARRNGAKGGRPRRDSGALNS